jgi:hypothetical protein
MAKGTFCYLLSANTLLELSYSGNRQKNRATWALFRGKKIAHRSKSSGAKKDQVGKKGFAFHSARFYSEIQICQGVKIVF